MTSPLNEQLTRYISDFLDDERWFQEILEAHSVEEILECAAKSLEGEADDAHAVLCFLRDLPRFAFRDEEQAAEKTLDLWRAYAPVLPPIRNLLQHEASIPRDAAIYTLAKLQLKEEVDALRDVYGLYCANYPISLNRLLGELRWLGDSDWVSAKAHELLEHPHFLVRWASLDFQSNETLAKLSSDASEWVAEECKYRMADLAFKEEADATKAERKAKAQQLAAQRPKILFESLSYANYSKASGSIEEIEQVLERVSQS